jgi:hypothetical protein
MLISAFVLKKFDERVLSNQSQIVRPFFFFRWDQSRHSFVRRSQITLAAPNRN